MWTTLESEEMLSNQCGPCTGTQVSSSSFKEEASRGVPLSNHKQKVLAQLRSLCHPLDTGGLSSIGERNTSTTLPPLSFTYAAEKYYLSLFKLGRISGISW
jgi:hypothetical protein